MDTRITQKMPAEKSTTPISWKMVARFAVVALVMPFVLFAAAGRVDWWQGWVYILITVVLSLISRYVVYLKNPDLIAERAHFTESEGIKDWDIKLVIWIGIVGPVAFLITAGLDKRFGWSADVILPVELGAIVVFLLGYAFSTWAIIVNTYFSSVVRIQTDRGQTVVTSGPYQFVRHPGYSGAMVAWLTSPILLGAPWSFIPTVIVVALYIVRTALEDKTLQNELPGYTEYAQQVRYRLLPGIW